jgi:hypothetical protein
MNKLSNFFRPISLILIITFFSKSIGYTKEISVSNDAPACGEWKIEGANSSNDQRLVVTLINQTPGKDCSEMFTLENKTGTFLGGGYTLALNDTSNNASIQYLPSGDKFLVPGLSIDIKTTPIDISKQENVNLQGEVTLGSYLAVDLSFFVLRSFIDLIPLPTGCLISYDQLLLISLRTAPLLQNTAKLISSGNLNGAEDEFSKVINIFFDKAGDYARDSGIDCFADFLKTSIGKEPIAIAKITLSLMSWVPVVIFDYFKYQGMPVSVNLSYVLPETVPSPILVPVDLTNISLKTEDLPLGYHQFTKNEIKSTFGQLPLEQLVIGVAGDTDLVKMDLYGKNPKIGDYLIVAFFYPLSMELIEQIDQRNSNSEMIIQQMNQACMGVQLLPNLSGMGNSSMGWTALCTHSRSDFLIIRRNNSLIFLIVMHSTEISNFDIKAIGQKIDQYVLAKYK